jgi:hypothetical protein
MATGKLSGQETGSRTEIDRKNAIGVRIGDLPEEDQHQIKEEMRCKLEEVEASRMRYMLACYQKNRNGIAQKADMTKASTSKVNASSLIPEDLVHLVGASVASKYGVDLSQITWVLAVDVCLTLDTFKQDWDNGLPRQIRSTMKQVLGNTQGK